MNPLRIVIEGWRQTAHSYALVNQWQCLHLRARTDVIVHHRDMPFLDPSWQQCAEPMTPELRAQLNDIPSPGGDYVGDVCVRMDFPCRIEPVPGESMCFLFLTAEQLTVPDYYFSDGLALKDRVLPPSVMFLTPSIWSKEGFVRSGLDPAKVHVVPHGVAADIFTPANEARRRMQRQRLGMDEGFYFLTVGSLASNKGLDLLIAAFCVLAKELPQVRLVVKGLDALYDSKLWWQRATERARKVFPKLSTATFQRALDRVIYVGDALDVNSLAGLYQAADCYVSPYRAEGFNIPVLEAAATGLPVICTEGGPTDEFTTPNFALRIASQRRMSPDGLSVILEPDVGSLLANMRYVVNEPAYCRAAGFAARAHVVKNYDWRLVVDGLVKVLKGSL